MDLVIKKNTGNLYDVYYKDKYGKNYTVRYFAYSKSDAERLFKSEQSVGEEIIKIIKHRN